MPVSDSCWSLAGVLIDEIACTFPTLKGLFERPVRSDQVGDRYSINVSSGVSDQGVRTFSTPGGSSRHIADLHWNRMKPGGKSKADFGFRRNRPFAASVKNL